MMMMTSSRNSRSMALQRVMLLVKSTLVMLYIYTHTHQTKQKIPIGSKYCIGLGSSMSLITHPSISRSLFS